jgi:hypothetical protein
MTAPSREPPPAGRDPGPNPSRDPSRDPIVTDALGFCRLAANRITPAELDPYMTGDPARAAAVLAAACTLALD